MKLTYSLQIRFSRETQKWLKAKARQRKSQNGRDEYSLSSVVRDIIEREQKADDSKTNPAGLGV